MGTKNSQLLGKQVLPLPISRSQISGVESDKVNGGMGAWLTGDKARDHYKRAVDRFQLEHDEESVNQKWYIFSVHADGTFYLRSEYGLERQYTSFEDFEVIKDGDMWGS